MGRLEKLRQRIARNPRAVRFEDLDRLLRGYGFELRSTSGSHRVYKLGQYKVVVPYRRPHILPLYVKRVLAIIERIKKEWNDERNA